MAVAVGAAEVAVEVEEVAVAEVQSQQRRSFKTVSSGQWKSIHESHLGAEQNPRHRCAYQQRRCGQVDAGHGEVRGGRDRRSSSTAAVAKSTPGAGQGARPSTSGSQKFADVGASTRPAGANAAVADFLEGGSAPSRAGTAVAAGAGVAAGAAVATNRQGKVKTAPIVRRQR